MNKLLIKNAEVPGEQARVNLLIQDGIIESISNAKESQDQTDPNTKVIDASACCFYQDSLISTRACENLD